MLRCALALVDRDLDDLTDLELFSRLSDEGWYIDLCVDQLHRLPSEIDPVLGCREYTMLQARAIVRQAQAVLMRKFSAMKTGFEA